MVENRVLIPLYQELKGTILDIGGGGEAVIGQLYGEQVIAIDNRQEELDEAPSCCKKILMDATDMTFNENHFDNITSFYTLMFMSEKTQQQAICEAVRVLKPNGEFHIWDCNIDSAYPVPFVTEVEITLPDRNIKTAYGVEKMDTQSINSIKLMCKTVGLTIECIKEYDSHFYIKCRKV